LAELAAPARVATAAKAARIKRCFFIRTPLGIKRRCPTAHAGWSQRGKPEGTSKKNYRVPRASATATSTAGRSQTALENCGTPPKCLRADVRDFRAGLVSP